ncbi:STAS domain-containing protein [Cryptosporangium aurantiacum]|uniref:RsbT antagonist protein RsbS n=1 Tax=Cryptosporangium aurantiacum TaxID=134849 RepID=A0A1M7IGZ4_9ACTN|nr:STAS domain-containing protein [Cryptosporangium aurantiacum]SHM40116.1 rsbT antagonist protein RsbS [Cryptosporangium aurantiacum]
MPDEVPIMRIGRNLLVTLQGDLEDATVEQIERVVTREVARTEATGMLIDISGLTLVDSFVARVIARLVGMVRLLGARTTVVGMQPAVAITLVELGVSLKHVHTALNAEQGMARLRGRQDERLD